MSQTQLKFYKDYSIGFLTRGCFRRCPFCVNQNKTHVVEHSPLEEFVDSNRPKICLLDDNFLGYSNWKEELLALQDSKKPFRFHQGLDERLLTQEKCDMLFSSKYDGDFIFAFDSINDYDVVRNKLELIRQTTSKTNIKFYVLCGFTSTDQYDIESVFKRIELLMKYKTLPYIMRYRSKTNAPWAESPFRSLYIAICRWVNQPNMFKKTSFREFCLDVDKNGRSSCQSSKAFEQFEKQFPEISKRYFDLRYS